MRLRDDLKGHPNTVACVHCARDCCIVFYTRVEQACAIFQPIEHYMTIVPIF